MLSHLGDDAQVPAQWCQSDPDQLHDRNTGWPREIKIEAPVEGAQVSGIIRLLGTITIAPFEDNLVYRVSDLGGVELSAGPVNVEATDSGALSRFEKAIDLGNIITNTTVRIAVEDRNVADGSLFAMDSVLVKVR